MTKKLNKRGFTIVELVVVIVVIAILAAVLIPTVSSLVAKANLSADQQAVRQMNNALAICDEPPKTIADAKNALAKSGYDANEYKPLSSDCEFYWVPSLNRIILTDINNKVVFPANIATESENVQGTWFSLSGSGNYAAVESITEQINNNTTDITLSGTTNFNGASINLKVSQNTTIGGTDGSPATLENMVSDEGSRVNAGTNSAYAEHKYFCGLISEVPENTEVTVQNLVIDGAVIGDTTNPKSAWAGIIAGSVKGTLNIKNVTVKNCTVFGQYRVGALVGCVAGGTVNIENVTVENTTVKGCQIVAALIGGVNVNSTISYTNVKVTNVSVEYSSYNNNNGYWTQEYKTKDSGDKFVLYLGNNCYYAYLTNNYAWIQAGTSAGYDNYTDHTYYSTSEDYPKSN